MKMKQTPDSAQHSPARDISIEEYERKPIFGGYTIRPQKVSAGMSDDKFIKRICTAYKHEAEEAIHAFSHSDKAEKLSRWCNKIEKLRDEIVEIRDDKTLKPSEKQFKIARRLEIIANYNRLIHDTVTFLQSKTKQHTK